MMKTSVLLAVTLACGTAQAQAPAPANPSSTDTAAPTPITGRDARTLSDSMADPDEKRGSASMPGRTGMGAPPTRLEPLMPTRTGRSGSSTAPSQLPVPGPG
jgi:hypothetical protein